MARNLCCFLRKSLFIIAGVLCSGALMAQEPSSTSREADRRAISAILEEWEQAWNGHDMRALANLFHEDGVWVLWTGQVWTGRKAIEDGHVEVHRTVFRNSVQHERLEELNFVGPDAAVVRFCSTLTGDARAPEKRVRSRKILVVTRRDEDRPIASRVCAQLGVSVRTLQEWEQGRRAPSGAARTLLLVAAKNPHALLDVA